MISWALAYTYGKKFQVDPKAKIDTTAFFLTGSLDIMLFGLIAGVLIKIFA